MGAVVVRVAVCGSLTEREARADAGVQENEAGWLAGSETRRRHDTGREDMMLHAACHAAGQNQNHRYQSRQQNRHDDKYGRNALPVSYRGLCVRVSMRCQYYYSIV